MTIILTLLLFTQTPSTEQAHFLKTFYLTSPASAQRMTEIATALRQRIAIRAATSNGVNAIAVRDTMARIDQAERIIAEFSPTRSSSTVPIVSAGSQDETEVLRTFYLSDAATQQDLTEILTALRTLLNARFLAMNTSANAILMRDSWNQMTLAAKVISDLDRSQPGDVGVPASPPITLPVTEPNQANVESTERTIPLANITTQQGMFEIVIALRTLLNVKQVEARNNAIILRDTESNIVIAERLVADLDKPSRR